MNVDDIVPQIQHKHVVITGGEPTIWPLDELIHSIRSFTNGLVYIQMESSGQKKLRGNLTPDWITWSPKRNLDFMAPPEFMILVDEVKFVVDAEFSFADVDPVLKNLTALDSMMQTISFMAEGCPPTPDSLQKAMEFAKEYDGAAKKVMACDRLQYRMEVK